MNVSPKNQYNICDEEDIKLWRDYTMNVSPLNSSSSNDQQWKTHSYLKTYEKDDEEKNFDVVFNVVDLHGMTVHEAYTEYKKRVEEAYYNNIKTIRFITGKSGIIRQEFPQWNSRYARNSVICSGDGSFDVFIK